jgi:AraC-like DNA-binding protein
MFEAHAREPVKFSFPAWGIYVLESHHARGFRMENTAHAFFKLMYVLDGRGTIPSKNAEHPIQRGDVVAVAPGVQHRIVDDPKAPLALIVHCIQPNILDLLQEKDARTRFPEMRIFWRDALSQEARRVLRQIMFEQSLPRAAGPGMITGLTLQLIASVLRVAAGHEKSGSAAGASVVSAPEARVHAYLRDLETTFCDNEKIDNVAERLGISRRYFTSLFRKIAGTSWLDHVRSLRIKHAQALLQKSERSITVIAFECGFDDLSSFYRAFKAQAKTTPQAWREARGQGTVGRRQ